jgi:hypothetical protein
VLVGACGGGETREADESGAAVASVAQAPTPPDSTPQLRRFLPDDLRRSTRPGTFAHGAHVRIGCAVCHEAPRGHDAHGGLACAECHRASAEATLAVLSPEQCQSCHHAADQTLTCEHCHESRGALESTQTLAFGVWSAPRERALPFDHAAHVELDCASCHTTAPALSPAASCASCHDAHMEAAVRCVSCHVAPAVGTHDVDAHLTCSGAGCHSAPIVEALAGARPVCLLCHQAQTEHEPAGNCVDCHRVRPGGGATGGGS